MAETFLLQRADCLEPRPFVLSTPLPSRFRGRMSGETAIETVMRDFAETAAVVQEADVIQVKEWLDRRDVLLVDVRETHEFEEEHISGAMLMPLSHFEPEAFPSLPGVRVVVHCGIGKRSEAARKMLAKHGHGHVINMSGGLAAWKSAGFDVEAA